MNKPTASELATVLASLIDAVEDICGLDEYQQDTLAHARATVRAAQAECLTETTRAN